MQSIGNSFNSMCRPKQQKIPHATEISYGYFIDPSHQPILTAYYKSINLKFNQTQTTTINVHNLEELNKQLLTDKKLPNQTQQAFLLFKVGDYYIFTHHHVLPTNTRHNRVTNLITFHNLLRKYDVKFFCAGQVCRNEDNLSISQKSDVVVSEEQWDHEAWDTLSKKWNVRIDSDPSKHLSQIFDKWILHQLFKH